MRCAVLTFGCRVNRADSQQVEADLLARGARLAHFSQADLVIVNTCSVTAAAEQGARQTIRRIARDNPDAAIVATGCYATRCGRDLAALPAVIRVVPNERKDRLVADLASTTAPRFGGAEDACGATLAPGMAGRTVCTLRVQTGCDERCSYCIVPSTRGAASSRSIDAVLTEVHRAVAAGFKEIVLTGVHLGSYGRDLADPASLLALLRVLDDRASGDVLFRIGSLEPMDCSSEIIDLVRRSRRFAPHFHLPMQHASDRILRAMRRPYTCEDYGRLVNGIRSRLPHASIGADVIVGFPGERPVDLEVTLAYLESSPLTHLHVFPYSDRPGTDAAALPFKASAAEIRRRARLVREVGRRLSARFHRTQVGEVRRALTIDDGSLVVTDNYLRVRIPPGRVRNERVSVRLVAAGGTLTGEIV
jgi:threonylcarbamoyladenosine tRNA methylthiotransferase MtaB